MAKIAADTGFGNARNLNTAFRKAYSTLPSDFRRLPDTPSEASASLGLRDWAAAQLKKAEPLLDTAVISVTTPPLYHVPEAFLQLLEFGSAGKLLNTGFRQWLADCQRRFHFRYIRLTGIFDNTLLAYIDHQDHILWDFSSLDLVLEYVLSLGLTPVLTISSIPNILAAPDSSSHFGFSNVGEPTDIPSWRSLIRSFLTHLIEQFGEEQLLDWKIGIWFLPSGMGIHDTGTLSDQAYIQALAPCFTLYREAYRVIRSLCPSIAIGPPEGDREDLLKFGQSLDWMFRYFMENDCPPDYFIYHDNWGILDRMSYDGQTLIYDRHISLADAVGDASRLCGRIRQLSGKRIPIYCTCWCCMPHGCPINETVFAASAQAAYLLKSSHCLTMAAVGPCSDYPDLRRGMATEFWGGCGLMTPHQIPRPFYYALAELQRLPGPILYTGDHCLIAKIPDGFCIYLWNVPDLSYRMRLPGSALQRLPLVLSPENFFQPGTNEPLFSDMRHVTELTGQPQLYITVCLQNLPAETYLLESISIHRHHGCAYDEWIREGAFDDFTPTDYEELAMRSLPGRAKKRIYTSGRELQLECMLQPSEFRVISLTG